TGTIVYDDSDATGTNTESNWFYLYPYGTTAIYLSISPQDINTKVDTYFTLTGRLYTLSGSTTTGIPDKTVYLQYTPDIKAPWSNVTSTTTDSNGVVSFLHSESQWGTYYYRLKFFGDDTYASATSSTCTAVISSGGSSEGGIGVDSDSPFEVIDVDFGGDYGDWVDVEIDPDNPIEGTFQPDGTWHADIPYTVNVPEGTEEGEYEIPYTVRIRDPNTGTITDLQGTMKILVQAIPEVTMWIFGFIIFLILIGGLIVNKRRNRHEY
ncbi:MAG: hypothetical protein H3Z50_03405, partial [archaeon]|nr:hypothetical protein [archaeon]